MLSISLAPSKNDQRARDEAYLALAESLVADLDAREHETGLHSRRVACHTLVLARRFTDDKESLRQLVGRKNETHSAFHHQQDVGKRFAIPTYGLQQQVDNGIKRMAGYPLILLFKDDN